MSRAIRPSHRRRDERGATAVEYGLLIAGIAALIVIVVFAFGARLTSIFTDTSAAISPTKSLCPDGWTETPFGALQVQCASPDGTRYVIVNK